VWLWGDKKNAGCTTLAVIIGKTLIDQGYKVRFIKMLDLKRAYNDFNPVEFNKELDHYNVYIIDDAFSSDIWISEKQTHIKDELFHFIDSSLEQGKKFICTSDCNYLDIPDRFYYIKHIFVRHAQSFYLAGSFSEYIEALKGLK
jgi:DNA replication protein DnaC